MENEAYASEQLTLVWLLLIVVVVVTYVIQRNGWHWVPPASCAMVLGIAAGAVGKLAGLDKPLRFSPTTFFYALLPPVVFAAGFKLKRRAFFQNFGSILVYAVLGTCISAFVFGLATYGLVVIGAVSRSKLGASPFIECLMYGSAISSTDPVATLTLLSSLDVPPLMYNLVFGESVLNDAVGITLFRALERASARASSELTLGSALHFVFGFCRLALGSLVVGGGVALAAAFMLKRFVPREAQAGYGLERQGTHDYGSATDRGLVHTHGYQGAGNGSGNNGSGSGNNHSGDLGAPPTPLAPPAHAFDGTVYEMAIVVMSAYLAYLVAEVAGMSGIVALFFTGICHAHYSYYNVSRVARVTLKELSEFASFMCELFVMAYLGLQVVTMEHAFDYGLLVSGIPLAVISRAVNIFPCSALLNRGRRHRLPRPLQTVLWASGLRGAVAYGLIVNLPSGIPGQTGIPAIETATLLIVVVSNLVLGSTTGPLLRHLNLVGKEDADLYGLAALEEEAGVPWNAGFTTPARGPHASGPGSSSPGGEDSPLARRHQLDLSEPSWFHDRFKELDETVLKPLFGGKRTGATHDWIDLPADLQAHALATANSGPTTTYAPGITQLAPMQSAPRGEDVYAGFPESGTPPRL